MSKQKNHQTLIDDHRGLLQFGRRLSIASGSMQFSLLIFANAWKHLGFSFYEIGAPLLFAVCLYRFVKDFFAFLRVEIYGSQLILEGISMEKKNISTCRYFHEVLEDFNFTKILSQRSFMNFLAFGCLCYFLSQFIIDLNPNLTIHRGWLVVLSVLFTAITCAFYYVSLKPLEEAKELESKKN